MKINRQNPFEVRRPNCGSDLQRQCNDDTDNSETNYYSVTNSAYESNKISKYLLSPSALKSDIICTKSNVSLSQKKAHPTLRTRNFNSETMKSNAHLKQNIFKSLREDQEHEAGVECDIISTNERKPKAFSGLQKRAFSIPVNNCILDYKNGDEVNRRRFKEPPSTPTFPNNRN